jgi:aminoglycoside phosphotransferase (APT) family kinase protein
MSDPMAVARARKSLAEAGLPTDLPLERADSVTNEVWFAGPYVVRVNRHPNQRLRREAFLGPRLPADVGYPEVVAYGGSMGADWLVLKRRPGGPLSRAWPGMSTDERHRASRQLAVLMKRLHQVDAPTGLPPTDVPQLLSPDGIRAVEPLLAALDQLDRAPNVDPGLVGELRQLVDATGHLLEPFAVPTLIHGDLHFENVLWDGYVITALLDFEYSRAAPADLELDVFLRFCAYPFLHVAADYEDRTRAEDYAQVPYWVAEVYPELFDRPHLLDRLRLTAAAYDVQDLLTTPMTRPPSEQSPHHAYRRLERLLRGTSHLDQLAGCYRGMAGSFMGGDSSTSGDPCAELAHSPDGGPALLSPGGVAAMVELAATEQLPKRR